MHCLADITPPIKLKHLCQILCRDNFYFEKINPRLKLLTGHRICDYLMKKRMMALGYVYGVRLQTKVRVNQDTFCMIMN